MHVPFVMEVARILILIHLTRTICSVTLYKKRDKHVCMRFLLYFGKQYHTKERGSLNVCAICFWSGPGLIFLFYLKCIICSVTRSMYACMYAPFGYIFVTRWSLVVLIMHIMYRLYTDREVRFDLYKLYGLSDCFTLSLMNRWHVIIFNSQLWVVIMHKIYGPKSAFTICTNRMDCQTVSPSRSGDTLK